MNLHHAHNHAVVGVIEGLNLATSHTRKDIAMILIDFLLTLAIITLVTLAIIGVLVLAPILVNLVKATLKFHSHDRDDDDCFYS